MVTFISEWGTVPHGSDIDAWLHLPGLPLQIRGYLRVRAGGGIVHQDKRHTELKETHLRPGGDEDRGVGVQHLKLHGLKTKRAN